LKLKPLSFGLEAPGENVAWAFITKRVTPLVERMEAK
jgi:hypothetical protein